MADSRQWKGFDREKSAAVLAAETKTDRRSRRTRQTLHETLMRLTVERGYDAISVADIVNAADIGRSTFYAHFTDKDDLLRSAAGSLRVALIAEHDTARLANSTDYEQTLGFSRFMTEHLQEQQVLYQALMAGRAGPIFMDLIRHAVADIVRRELSPYASTIEHLELTVQFLVGAYLSVLTWWLDRGAKETPRVVESAFGKLAMSGIGGLVTKAT